MLYSTSCIYGPILAFLCQKTDRIGSGPKIYQIFPIDMFPRLFILYRYRYIL